MRCPPKRVEDPDIEPFEPGPGGLGNGRDVRQVGDVTYPEAERVDRAVIDLERRQDDLAAGPGDGHVTVDRVHVEDRRVGRALRLDESVAEAAVEPLLRRTVGPDRQS